MVWGKHSPGGPCMPEGSASKISLYHRVVPTVVPLNIWREHPCPAAETARSQTNLPIDHTLVPRHWNWLEWSPERYLAWATQPSHR